MGMRKEKKSEVTTQAGHLNVVTVIAVVMRSEEAFLCF